MEQHMARYLIACSLLAHHEMICLASARDFASARHFGTYRIGEQQRLRHICRLARVYVAHICKVTSRQQKK